MSTVTLTSLTDEEIAATALGPGQCDREALGELLSRYAVRLHRFFVVRLRDTALAEELAQDVFERVIRAGDKFKAGHAFRPWLWAIARNVAVSAHRKRHSAPHATSLDESADPDGLTLQERVADSAPSPRHSMEEQERSARLWDAIEQLEDDLREVLLLKHFDELPCREVAALLGVPEGTVWSRMHRALVRLREVLGPDMMLEGGGLT